MCVGDLRLGRLIKAIPKQLTITATVWTTIPADQQRVGLWIGLPVTGTVLIQLTPGALTNGSIRQNNTHHGIYFVSLYEHGNLPTLSHDVTITGAVHNLAIVEFILPEAALQAFLDDGKVEE